MEYPNWFAPYAQPMFEKHLLPFAGLPGLRFVQIGAFTGDASVWLLENVLTGQGSKLVDVDTWQGSAEAEHAALDWRDVESVYRGRMAGYGLTGRLDVYACRSETFWSLGLDPFDFIYVDGDHTPYGVLNDAVAAYRVLKPGGLLAFDDYRWVDSRTGVGPGPTIDAFADAYTARLQLLQLGAQAWFRKIA